MKLNPEEEGFPPVSLHLVHQVLYGMYELNECEERR